MDPVLEQIKQFADQAHGEQKRKYPPDRYIVHPIRVMEICREYTADRQVLAAALLHDVLEDTPVTRQNIRDFLLQLLPPAAADRTLDLVISLTDVYVKESYPHWNRRKRKAKEAERAERTDADAQTIKYADIIDNSTGIVHYDPDFARVFLGECRELLKRMTKGNSELRERAVAVVEDGIQQLKRRGK